MSPILPQYQRLPHDDKNYLESWRNSPVAKEVDDVDLLTTYPPRHGSGTASGSGSRQSVVTFIFVPRWPVKGKKESVLGTMGRDKEETTAMAQRAFPTLAHYPADRIEFLSPEDKDAKIESDGWSRILDDTWDRLYTDGPERLKVQVADGPGEAGKRKWREIAIILGTMSSPIIVGVLVLAILWASGKLDDDELAMRDCRKSVPTRCPTHRKPPRPPETPPLRLAPLSTFILLFIALLSLLHPTHGLAQETTSHSSSSNPSPSAISTISISGLPSLLTLPPLNSTAPTIQLDLPTTSSLYITLNICSLGANTSLIPSVLLSTASPTVFNLGTRPSADRESGGVGRANRRSRAGTTWLLEWDMGFANWTSTGEEVGVAVFLGMGLRVDGSVDGSVLGQGNVVVQIGIAGDAPLHSLSPAAPLLGDTTSTSLLLFSPLLLSSPHPQPSYPNYTLPPPQLSLPTYPSPLSNLTSLSTNLSLILVLTASSPTLDGLDNSLCAVQSTNSSTGAVADPRHTYVNATTSWMSVGGEEGFRTMWVVGELLAETNYTAWIVDERGVTSAAIWFSTKEASFPCQLVVPTPLCPSIAYAAPLPPNTTGSSSYPITALPSDITRLITISLQSFTTSLLTTACGRDLYSHLSSCADCHAAYRDWVCRVVVPQCASSSTTSSASSGSSLSSPPSAQTIFRTPASPRNPTVVPGYEYDELLPCLSVCNAVDRACPVFLGFRCPIRGVTANASYGFLGGEADQGDGSPGTGLAALDRWGNRWCNG